jgi:uncharacterized coiled-coil protein SlyX
MARHWNAQALVCVCLAVASAGEAAAKPGPAAAKTRGRVAKSAAEPAAGREVLAALEELQRLVLEQRREIEAQRAELRAQAEKLARMEQRMTETGPPAAAAPAPPGQDPMKQKGGQIDLLEKQLEAMADSQNELTGRVTRLTTDVTAQNRANDARFRQFGNFRLSGDLRFRYEPFFQSGQTTRQRQRIRARLNLQGNITDEIFGGITFATGSLDDPLSTNQNLTGFFNRKQVGFDRYFIQYTPKWARNHAQFGAGKFAYPWIRTPLTFDTDMNPEGVYTRLNWDFKNARFKGVSAVGFHLPFFERGGSTSATTGVRADGLDGFITGGQLQTRWKLGDRVSLGLHVAGINFVNADLIAQGHSASAATPALSNNLIGNQPITNCIRTNAAGATVGYCSRFLYLNTILTLGVNTGRPRWPVNFTFDFNNNTRAQRIIQNGTAAPTGLAHNRERSAYWAEVQFGRLSEVKDAQFGYTFIRIERDALVTAFAESDLRAGSNLAQHRLTFSYQWFSNFSFNYALWMGRLVNAQDNIALVPGGIRAIAGGPCNAAPFTGCRDSILKRQAFDFIYRF